MLLRVPASLDPTNLTPEIMTGLLGRSAYLQLSYSDARGLGILVLGSLGNFSELDHSSVKVTRMSHNFAGWSPDTQITRQFSSLAQQNLGIAIR